MAYNIIKIIALFILSNSSSLQNVLRFAFYIFKCIREFLEDTANQFNKKVLKDANEASH